MGGGMAANLAKAGHEVHAFDLSEAALAKAEERGCKRAASAADAATQAEAVISMLPAGRHVREVYEGQILGAAPQTAILIDCSTIDVGSARDVIARALEQGYAKPFLELMGKAVIHAGGPGAGQAAKICNNMLLGASMIATCETFVLAQKLGLDPQTFFDIASKASGQCWSMTSYCPVPGVGPETPADRGYDGGFAAALMLKDLRLAMEAAGSVDAYTPMGAEAEELYTRFAEKLGGAGKDFSAIINMINDSWTAPTGHIESLPPGVRLPR
jgi:3-hydroxyisobutyrate dehydrogenase